MRFTLSCTLSGLSLLVAVVVQTSAVAVTPYGYSLEEILDYQKQHPYWRWDENHSTVVRRHEDQQEERLERRDTSSSRHHHGQDNKPSKSLAKTSDTHCIPYKKRVVKRDDEHFVWLYKRSAPVRTTAKCKGVQRLHPLP